MTCFVRHVRLLRAGVNVSDRQPQTPIVNNMADVNGPDLVALLANEVSYGAYGDHGGASEPMQRVPMVFWSTAMASGNDTSATFHTADVMPTILEALVIEQTYPTDGQARSLN